MNKNTGYVTLFQVNRYPAGHMKKPLCLNGIEQIAVDVFGLFRSE